MGLFADGGKMSTKPYISSGAYVHKMSNYCDSCSYDVTLKTGPKACPFNSLYWHFIDQHVDTLKTNPRMGMMLKVWNKMDTDVKDAILSTAKNHLLYE
jgi:deoxyribodipyrimidine photolyase-related protein